MLADELRSSVGDGTSPLQFQREHFALTRPIFWSFDQPRTHRVLPYVLPFQPVRFRRTKNVIEKAFLPERSLVTLLPQRLCQRDLENLHPSRKAKPFRRDCHEEVEVVRHQDVAPNEDATCRGLLAKNQEGLMLAFLCKQAPPPLRGCSDEENGAVGEEPRQALKPGLVHLTSQL